LQREVVESNDPECRSRLDAIIQKVLSAPSTRTGSPRNRDVSPRRRGGTHPEALIISPAPAKEPHPEVESSERPEPLPRGKALPVVPTKMIVIGSNDDLRRIVPVVEPNPSRIVRAAEVKKVFPVVPSLSLGLNINGPAVRLNVHPAGVSPAAPTPSPRSGMSAASESRGFSRSSFHEFERLPILVLFNVFVRLPIASVRALACCNTAIREIISKFHSPMSKRANVILEIGKKRK
jgi:hypothetical protein